MRKIKFREYVNKKKTEDYRYENCLFDSVAEKKRKLKLQNKNK